MNRQRLYQKFNELESVVEDQNQKVLVVVSEIFSTETFDITGYKLGNAENFIPVTTLLLEVGKIIDHQPSDNKSVRVCDKRFIIAACCSNKKLEEKILNEIEALLC